MTIINICPASTFTLLAGHFKCNTIKYEVVLNIKDIEAIALTLAARGTLQVLI